MNEWRTDFELLRDFARQGDQEAFGLLARRHLDLVYATALRKIEEPGAAEEVAQNVFLALARKAWQFAPDDSLPAWLYRTTLLEAKAWLRGDLRRRRREQAAAELGTTMKTPDEQPALRALLPLLDEALLSLREKERTAVLLRFYEGQSLRQVGDALGIGEDAAQKRVAGAVQKLTAFFVRRGFKSVTAAVAAAALEHTAVSAPAVVASSVSQAAAQMAPPALGTLMAVVARWASLTKWQAAAACLAFVAVPAGWQWRALRQTEAAARQARTEWRAAEMEYSTLQTEVVQLGRTSTQLEAELKKASESARQSAETVRSLEEWKKRLRGALLAEQYRWPQDSPFVRIPKSVLLELNVHQPVSPPGELKREVRELLGLTPQERLQVEAALQKHFAALDDLIEARITETNAVGHFGIPKGALASQAWVVPALGDEVKARADELQQALRTTLGEERWPMVQVGLESSGTDTLRRVLNLDAGQESLELAVWLQEKNGKIMVGYGWAGHFSTFSSEGVSLDLFLPGKATSESEAQGVNPLEYISARNFPPAITKRLLAWVEQQALSRLGKESEQ